MALQLVVSLAASLAASLVASLVVLLAMLLLQLAAAGLGADPQTVGWRSPRSVECVQAISQAGRCVACCGGVRGGYNECTKQT